MLTLKMISGYGEQLFCATSSRRGQENVRIDYNNKYIHEESLRNTGIRSMESHFSITSLIILQ